MSADKRKYKLYYEKNDKKNIYMEINDLAECCFEIWEYEGSSKSSARIKIPIESWEEIIKKWKISDFTRKRETEDTM